MKGFLLFVSLACIQLSFSQTNNDAYSVLLSGAQVNQQSSLSLFYNPSLQAKQTEIGIGSSLLYPNTSVYNLQFAYSHKKDSHTLGGGLARTSYAQYGETTGLLHYALQLDSTWSIGMTAGLNSTNYETKRTYLPQFSLGIHKQVHAQISFSLSLFNYQSSTYLKESLTNKFHQRWVLGTAYHSLNKQFSTYLSVQHDHRAIIALALYYRLTERIHFFVAGKSSPTSYSFGGRFNLQSLSLFVGFHYHSYLGFSPSTVAEYAF